MRTDSLPETLRRSLPARAPECGTSKPGFCVYSCTYGDGLTLVKGRRSSAIPFLGGMDDDSTLTFCVTSILYLKKHDQRDH